MVLARGTWASNACRQQARVSAYAKVMPAEPPKSWAALPGRRRTPASSRPARTVGATRRWRPSGDHSSSPPAASAAARATSTGQAFGRWAAPTPARPMSATATSRPSTWTSSRRGVDRDRGHGRRAVQPGAFQVADVQSDAAEACRREPVGERAGHLHQRDAPRGERRVHRAELGRGGREVAGGRQRQPGRQPLPAGRLERVQRLLQLADLWQQQVDREPARDQQQQAAGSHAGERLEQAPRRVFDQPTHVRGAQPGYWPSVTRTVRLAPSERTTATLTCWPGFSPASTSASVAWSGVGLPLTAAISSPVRMPALAAGPPACAWVTSSPPAVVAATSTPR